MSKRIKDTNYTKDTIHKHYEIIKNVQCWFRERNKLFVDTSKSVLKIFLSMRLFEKCYL